MADHGVALLFGKNAGIKQIELVITQHQVLASVRIEIHKPTVLLVPEFLVQGVLKRLRPALKLRGLGIISLAAPLGDLPEVGNRHAVGGRHNVLVSIGANLQHLFRARAKIEQAIGAGVAFYKFPAHALHPFENRCSFFGVIEKSRVSRLGEVILEDAHFRKGILRVPIGVRRLAVPRHLTARQKARPNVSQEGLAKALRDQER